jgi:hypothetical protein
MKAAFQYIRQRAEAQTLSPSDSANLNGFLNYVNNHWITQIGPHNLTIHEAQVRVSSGMESVNRQINRLVKQKHPDFYFFLCECALITILPSDAS